METAILIVAIAGFVLIGAYIYHESSVIQLRIQAARAEINALRRALDDLGGTLEEVRNVLVQASVRKAAKDSPFEQHDKMPAMPRYVPIARRRAQAEVASMGPATHDERVRENNARAMESAG